MSLLYRVLGFTAFLGAQMSRQIFNFIPLNIGLIAGGVLVINFAYFIELSDTDAGKSPRRLTVAQALSPGGAKPGDYVTLTGTVSDNQVPGVSSIEWSTKFVPLVDPVSKRGIMVSRQPINLSGKGMVTGMLRSVTPSVGKVLREKGGHLGEFRITDAFQLNEGEAPAHPLRFPIIVLLAGVPSLLLFIVALMRHTIFRKMPDKAPSFSVLPSGPPESASMRFSGYLTFAEGLSQYFQEVPIGLGVTKSQGARTFVSQIDATVISSCGVKDRFGNWAAVIEPDSWREEAIGLIYFGTAVRPALRVSFRDIAMAQPRQVRCILSFDTEADRDRMRVELRLPPRELPAKTEEPTEVPAPPALMPPLTPPPRFTSRPVSADTSEVPAALVGVPYKPSGRVAPIGIALMFATGLAGAVLLGGVYHFVTNFRDIPVLFPGLFGLAAGGCMLLAIRIGKCRNLLAALVVSVLIGLSTYGVRLIFDSQAVRPKMVNGLANVHARRASVPIVEARERMEHELNPLRTLRIYLAISARQGLRIGRSSSSMVSISTDEGSKIVNDNGAMVFKDDGYYVFIVAEAILVAVLAASIVAPGVRAPFCENTDQWLGMTRIVRLGPHQNREILNRIQAGDWQGLRAIRPEGHIGDQHFTDVVVYHRQGSPTAVLIVRTHTANSREELLNRVLPYDEAIRLLTAV
ncbi:MAG: hypothetical protein SFU56_19780 [Capsulimonadales bacterium]|nr:hypothetical protein [Capsulimonadales bacterium]